jgi:ribosomal protein S18 acetylase RimI-like enzyme
MWEMRIRRALPDDVPAMRLVTARAYNLDQVRLGYSPPPAECDTAAWVARNAAWVGEHDSEVIAVLLAEPSDGTMLVWSAVVDPVWQGEGNGRALMEHAEAVAREAGLAEVRLSTNVLMEQTISHYEKCGYEVRGRRPHPVQGDHLVADLVKPVS